MGSEGPRSRGMSLAEQIRRFSLILMGLAMIWLGWYFGPHFLFTFLIILGSIITLYGIIRIIGSRISKKIIQGRNDPAKLEENLVKYFIAEEFHNLPGFDITYMVPEGQSPTNLELGLVRGHLFDDLLIIVLESGKQIETEMVDDLLSQHPHFDINHNLTRLNNPIEKDGSYIFNYILHHKYSHNYNLLNDLNTLLAKIQEF